MLTALRNTMNDALDFLDDFRHRYAFGRRMSQFDELGQPSNESVVEACYRAARFSWYMLRETRAVRRGEQ